MGRYLEGFRVSSMVVMLGAGFIYRHVTELYGSLSASQPTLVVGWLAERQSSMVLTLTADFSDGHATFSSYKLAADCLDNPAVSPPFILHASP